MDFLKKIENVEKRNYIFLDYVRVLAGIGVVYNHMLINVKNDFYLSGMIENVIVFHHFITFLFFLLTGYTFMKTKTNMPLKGIFYMILKTYIGLMVFAIPFSFLEILWRANLVFNPIMIKDAILNAFKGQTWDHLWFIYMMIAVYIVLPILEKIYKNKNNIYMIIWTLFIGFIVISKKDFYINTPIYFFRWIPFTNVLFALTVGAFLQRFNILDKINNVILILVLFLFGFTWFYFDIFSKGRFVDLYSIFMAIVIFMIIRNSCKIKNKIVITLSHHNYLIYYIHVVFVHLLTKVVRFNAYNFYGYIGVLFFSLIIYFVSFGVAYLLKKILIFKYLY